MTEILAVLVLLLVLALAVAPLESLGWWSKEGGREMQLRSRELRRTVGLHPEAVPGTGDAAGHYLVFLSGIATIGGDHLPRGERLILTELAARLPGTRVVDDVFPYSAENRGLTARRPTAWLWRRIRRLRSRGVLIGYAINLRNVIQVLVCADGRYGPVYSAGLAQEIWRGLLRAGYRPADRRPVTLLAWSGGAEMALGAVWYLAALGMEVRVVSVGGVMGSDPGLRRVQHLWHLRGSHDRIQRLGKILAPGRWPISRRSAWNLGLAEGRITEHVLGPMEHCGRDSYMDHAAVLPDGRSYAEATIATIAELIVAAGLDPGIPDRRGDSAGAQPSDLTGEVGPGR